MVGKKFGTAINCIDGRVQYPVLEWLKNHMGVDYIDMITEPGPDKALTEGSVDLQESIRQRVLISLEKHASKVVAIVGHHDCAGNPGSACQHCEQIIQSAQVIGRWFSNIRVLGLWVNDNWEVEVVYDTERVRVA